MLSETSCPVQMARTIEAKAFSLWYARHVDSSCSGERSDGSKESSSEHKLLHAINARWGWKPDDHNTLHAIAKYSPIPPRHFPPLLLPISERPKGINVSRHEQDASAPLQAVQPV